MSRLLTPLVSTIHAFAIALIFMSVAAPAAANRIEVSPTQLTFSALGESQTVSVRVYDENNLEIVGEPVIYVVSFNEGPFNGETPGDNDFQQVPGGLEITAGVTGIGNISISIGSGESVNVPISVRQIPTTLTVTPDVLTLDAGQTVTLQAALSDANGYEIQVDDGVRGGAVVFWESSDSAIATVEGVGLVHNGKESGATADVTAVGEGTVTITANWLGVTTSVTGTTMAPGSLQSRSLRSRSLRSRSLRSTANSATLSEQIHVTVGAASANTAPTGLPTISGTARVGETLTASASGIADTDGLTNAAFAWQWIANDGTSDTDIAGATGSTYTLTSAEAGKTIKVRVIFTDDGGTEEALVSVATAAVNTAPTGLPTISGTAGVGEGLTASAAGISDADGLTNATFTWQWIANDGTSDADIAGATGAAFTVTAAEVGKTIKVRVTFTDDGGTEERLVTEATATVEAQYPVTTGPFSVSVQCVDMAANPRGPQMPDDDTDLWWEMHFSISGVRQDDDYGTASFEMTGQDGAGFQHGFASGGTADRFNRVERWSTRPSSAFSDVSGVVITVPAGVWQDELGNHGNTASANSLYLAHNWKVSVVDASAEEGTDESIDFEVTLNARDDCETVTVDWTTADVTATAGEDYVAASGMLTFGPGETSKTIRVALLETANVDGTEIFSVQLSNASGISVDDAEAIGRISGMRAANVPATGKPTVTGTARVGETLTASATGIADADGLTNATYAWQWIANDGTSDADIAGATDATYTLTPAETGKTIKIRVTFADDGGTEETLESAATAAVEAGLTARFENVPVSHDGASAFNVYLRFSEAPANVKNKHIKGALTITGGKILRVRVVGGVNGDEAHRRVEIEPDGDGDVQLSLLPTTDCAATNALCTEDGEPFEETITATVRGPDGEAPLTALFEDAPAAHDGASAFNVFLRFSEAPANVKNFHIKGALTITGGKILRVRVVGGVNGDEAHRRVEIEPDGDGDVQLSLLPTTDCAATNALCTADGRPLSQAVSATIPGPAPLTPEVSIAAADDTQTGSGTPNSSQVTEGTAAEFTLTRTGSLGDALTVNVSVTETGTMLAGTVAATVTFDANSSTAELRVETEDDEVAEPASAVTAGLAAGSGYSMDTGAASASVTVEDDDAAPAVQAVAIVTVPENTTAVVTLTATDDDTPVADLAWSMVGGADSAMFTVSAGGDLAFASAKDFEAADDADADGDYEVTVRVTDGSNPVDAALTVRLTDVDDVSPVLTDANVNGDALVLTFGEPLDGGSVPAPSAFSATVDGAVRGVSDVSIGASSVTLTLASAVAAGETVTVGYTVPTGANAHPLRDAAENAVAGFSNRAVTNATPASNAAPTGLPTISGTPQVGETLTASSAGISDADGLTNATYAWQWIANDGTSDADIAGATAATYTLTAAEAGKTIKVRATFTDDAETEEVLVSEPTAAVNTAPTGLPVISGTAQVGETLTASASGIADTDGLTNATYAWQWIANDGTADADISGATAATYTLTAAEAGKTIKVRATFTDDAEMQEVLVSEPTAAVNTAPTGLPTISGTPQVGETLAASASGIADTDGLTNATYAWQWIANDGTSDADIPSATGVAYTLTAAEAGKTIKVRVTFTDDAETQEVLVSEPTEAVNTAPTGLPVISGTAQVGETLTASASGIADTDGLTNATYAWQWIANDGTSDADIAGATGAEYTLTPAQEGNAVKVRVTFTDDGGTKETLVSEATAAVTAALPSVSVAAVSSPVTEGTAAAFRLSRTGDTAVALTVAVSVTVEGAVVSTTPASSVTFAAGSTEATLSVATVDDTVAEADARVRVSVTAGSGYLVGNGSGSATVDVYDNDEVASAPVKTLWTSTIEWQGDYGAGWVNANEEDFSSPGWWEDGNGCRIWYIAYGTASRELWLRVNADECEDGIADPETLTLHVGGVTVGPGDGLSDFARRTVGVVTGVEADWTPGEQVELRLTRTEAGETAVSGPGISVADAQVQEAEGAALSFRVTLAEAQTSAVSVRYATSDGTATAGLDYEAVSGAVRFAPGQTTRTVSVPVLNDAHDEGSETMTLTLSAPFGATIADGTATGTIVNTDPIPKAWIARFGRTVAEQVLEAVESRMRAPRAPGTEVSLAGQRVGGAASPAGGAIAGDGASASARASLADWLGNATDTERRLGLEARTMTQRDFLLGSSISFTVGTKREGTYALWGRGAVTRFDGRDGALSLDGEVTSGMLGADWSRDAVMAGLVVSHSVGEGGYRGESGSGEVRSSLTGLYPWGRYALSERVSVWGVAGYGEGTLRLTPEGEAPISTDLDLAMAAAGLRGVLVQAPETGGFELAVKTDAMGVRTSTAMAEGLEAEQAEVTRLRLGLEGSRPFRFEGGANLTPSGEIGVRHDGGDAETGIGVDIGGGFSWSDPQRGLSAEFRGRGLLTHDADGFRERGLSGSLSWDPAPETARGPSLSLSQTLGAQASGGMDALLERGTLGGFAANDNGDGGFAQRRFEMRLGYGMPAFGDRFTGTPEIGFGFSGERRDYSLGWRLTRAGRLGGAFDLSLEAQRRESANDNADIVHEIGFRLTARF